MTLSEFTTNATRACQALNNLASEHPEWDAVKSADGMFYIFDRSDRQRGYVSFAEGRVTLHPFKEKHAKA